MTKTRFLQVESDAVVPEGWDANQQPTLVPVEEQVPKQQEGRFWNRWKLW